MLGPALDSAVDQVERRLWSPVGWLAVSGPGRARGHRGLMLLDSFISRRIAEAGRAGPPSGTLLSSLLHAFPADPLGEAELHEELKALLFAGHTTTASALAWTWHVLSQHPDALEQIESECEAALGGRAPLLEDLPALGHTRRVIEEVLRLYPPTWLTARAPLGDDTLDGYVIPAGGLILLSPYLTHRHPAIWEHPERFDPDRFLPGAPPPDRFAYLPFGIGPRVCIGAQFALTEATLVLAAMLRAFRIERADDAPVTPRGIVTTQPDRAPPFLLHRRDGC